MSAEPDLYEGDDDTRERVCDWTGHDWLRQDEGEVCATCGAMRSLGAAGQTHPLEDER